MPSKARRYTYAESLTLSTSTSTTDATKVTLTFTPDASSNYVYIWNADIQATSGTAYDNIVTLKNNAGSTLSATNWEARDTTDFATISGIAFETFGASPTSQSITLTYRTENAGNSVGIRNARIIAIKLTAADAYVENTADASTTSNALQTATTLTFTPATTGNYLILGSAETRASATGVNVNSQITYSGVGYNVSGARANDNTNYVSGLRQASLPSLTNTSKTVTLQFSSGTSGTTVNCRRARLVALRLDEFGDSNITVDNVSTNTTSLSYTTKKSTGLVSTSPNLSYLVIGTAVIGPSSGSPTTISSGYGLNIGSVYSSESLVESPSGGNYSSTNFGSFGILTPTTEGGSLSYADFNYYSETASVTTVADDVTLSFLLLDPTDLYWVGGGGTWDSSTNTDWAVTSGGTGGDAAPKAGTNVYFDASSDSGAPFTVTIGTGAVCKNMTASGLDQTMTWSGSAAMSVYGNFSVPATNFTQSYTGTITFASNLSQAQTITTNGKSFTAFTFDGVGGTWTLQDAATITGAATLTKGTLELGSYTFTCDNFASSNSNTRTINFGTGKIVISSASTATVWNTGTVTNLTVSGTPLVELTGGGATTKTISAGALSEANSISFSLLNTAGTVSFTASNTVRNLIIANNSITISNIAITIYGNLTINGTTPTLTAGANAWTFAATSGTKTITTNGKTLDFPLTFNGVGGTWQLTGALTVGTSTSRAVTMSNGTFDLMGYDFTLYGTWNQTAGGIRLQNTGGTTNRIILTLDTNATVFDGNVGSGNTTDGNITVRVLGSNAATTRRYDSARGVGDRTASYINWEIAATAGTINFGAAADGQTFGDLTIENNSITFNFNGPMVLGGDFIVSGTNPTVNFNANIMYFSGTTGTQVINLNGNNSNTMDCPVQFNFYGTGTVQLAHNLNIGVATSRTVTFIQGTLDLNEYNLTIYGLFTSSRSDTRTIDFGSASKIILTLSGAQSWNTSTATNLSVIGTDPLVQLTATGGTATITMNSTGATESNVFSVRLSSATTTSVALTGSVRNLTIDNFDITLSNNQRTIYGNLTISGSNPTLTAGTSVMTFGATSGVKTITTSGKILDFPITFDGVGGTWQLQDALNVGTSTVRTVSLTNGNLDLAGFTFTIFGLFSSSNSNTRSIAFGSTGKIVLSTTAATTTTICSMTTETGLTVTGTYPLIQATGSGTGPLTVTSTTSLINLQLSPSAAAVFAVTTNVKDFTIDNNANITLNNSARSIYGNLTIGGTSPTLVAGSSITTFAATSGTKTITTNGKTIDFPITFNGVGGTWQLQDALSVGTSTARAVTLTSGTIDLNEYNMTIFGSFDSSGSNAKVIDFGSASKILLTLSVSASALSLNAATNLSYLGSNPLFEFNGSGGAGVAVVLSGSQAIEAAAPNLRINPASTVTATINYSFNNLTVENISGSTVNFTTQPRLYGNLVIAGTNPIFNSGTLTFSKTSGTQTITSNGKIIEFRMTIDGTGTVVQLLDALTAVAQSNNLTLTNGTLDLNEYTMTIGQFSSNNSNVREIDFGTSGKLVLSGLAATAAVVNCATVTNFTLTGNPSIEIAGSSSSARQYLFGSTAGNSIESNAPDLTVTATGTGTVDLTSSKFRNLTYNTSDTNGNITAGSSYCYGNLTSTNNGRIIGAGTITFAATSGTKTISLNAPAGEHQFNITINGIGGTFQAASNLDIIGSNSSGGNFTLTNGTFEAGSYNITARLFDSNNSNVRTLNLGSGTWTFTGTGAIWNTTTTTNLTFIKGTANISSTHASTTLVEFRGGGLTYNNFTTTSTLNRVDIYGNNTFNTLTIAAGGALRFEAGSTNTFSTFSFGNNSGDNAALDTTTAGVAATLVYAGSAKVRTNYVTVRDITGSPVDTWYMGPNSTNTSNNTNLYFYNPPLYWIGGSGTWNNSSTTNWSFFSGGSSAGYYPDQYTDVYFDAGSDSGSTFAVETDNITVNCRSFTASALDYAMTLRIAGSSSILNVYGDFSLPSTNFSFTGASGVSGVLTFASTSTGKTITTNGVSLLEVEFNGVGGGWTLQDNYTATVYTILTAGTITLNDKILTTPSFTFTGSTARSIAFGTNGKIVLTGSVAVPSNREWDGSTLTNFTVSGSRRVEYTDTSGISYFHGDVAGGVETNAVDLYITSATTGTHNINGRVRNLDFTGSSGGSWLPKTLTIYGNLTVTSGMSVDDPSGGDALTFAGTVTNGQTYQYITTNGKNIKFNSITFSGTAQYVLQDSFTCGDTGSRDCVITLTTGTIVMGNYDIIHTGSFSSTGSGVRGITSTGGLFKTTWNIGSSQVVWNTTTATNLTITDLTVELYGSGSGSTRTISPGSTGLTESNAISFVVDITNGTFAITSGHGVKNITFKDNAYTYSSTTATLTVYGNFTFSGSSNVTFTGGTGAISFAGTGTQTITTNSETIDKPITLNGTARYILGDALTVGSTRTMTFNSGNLDVNGYTMTVNTMVIPDNSTRVIDHGSNGTIVITGSGMSFNANGRNISYEGLGTINMTAGASKIFTANGNSFATLNQGGTGKLTVSNGGIFYNMTSTVANTFVEFYYLDNYTFTNDFQISGANNSHRITLISNTHPVKGSTPGGPNNARFYYTGNSVINVEYMLIRADDFGVSPNNTWYVRRSPKTIIGGQEYNDESANTLISFGYPVGDGWVFIRENNFFPFFL